MASRVIHNVDAYGKPVIGATECCNKLVSVYPVRSVYIKKYLGDRTKDDWGVSTE
jgi:hypothetical protein